jgi:hypothetical protein
MRGKTRLKKLNRVRRVAGLAQTFGKGIAQPNVVRGQFETRAELWSDERGVAVPRQQARQIAARVRKTGSDMRNAVQQRCSITRIAAHADRETEQQMRLDIVAIVGDKPSADLRRLGVLPALQ